MKRKRVLLVVLAVVIAGAITGLGLIRAKMSDIERQLEGITISDVNLAQVEDGVYTGSHSVFPVSAEVRVTVRDHTITAIELVKHEHGKGEAAEVITDRVVESQSLLVDTISGATHSSKVILKAVENALAGAE